MADDVGLADFLAALAEGLELFDALAEVLVLADPLALSVALVRSLDTPVGTDVGIFDSRPLGMSLGSALGRPLGIPLGNLVTALPGF